MALATKCPQCGALFRVVADQLKLRGGLVRCGQCRAVFDAIGSLTYVEDGTLTQARTPADEAPPSTAAERSDDQGRQATGPSTTLRIPPVAPATLAGGLPPRIESPQSTQSEPAVIRRRAKRAGPEWAESTAGDHAEASATDWHEPVPTLAVRDESQQTSALEESAAAEIPRVDEREARVDTAVDEVLVEEPAPTFTRAARGRRPGFSIVYVGGTALLVLLAAVQLAVIFRGQLMIHWPQSRLMLVDLCEVFGCTVHWPTQADRLAVLGTELQSIPGTDVLELNAVIRNRAEFRQSLPAVEVTLTDARNRALARKVFTPADYLSSAGEPTARLQEGLAPGSDFTIRIFFEARGLTPAGFLVYPFYL